MPSGWGRHLIRRVIKFFTYQWGENILGRIDQMSSSSTEYIYVRGGAKYQFYVSPRVGTPTIRTTTYTALDQSISPITSYNGMVGRIVLEQPVLFTKIISEFILRIILRPKHITIVKVRYMDLRVGQAEKLLTILSELLRLDIMLL